jgi:hypothetical protein
MVYEQNMSMKHGWNDTGSKTTALIGYNRQTKSVLVKLPNW